MPFQSLVARLPYPSFAVQRAVAIAAVIAQAGIGVTGSVVRVTGSGLGCPTWPQCVEGSIVPVAHPEFDALTQWIEFSNRMLTGVVILVAALCVITAWRVQIEHPSRRRLVKLAWTMPAGVMLQAVVGGITVLAKLEWWTVALHFLASTPLVWLAVLLLRAFKEGDEPARWLIPDAGRKTLIVLAAAMWAVLVAGTVVTGAGPHGGDPGTHRLQAPIETLTQVHGGLLVVYLIVLAVFGLQLMRGETPKPVWRRYTIVWVVALSQGVLGSVQYALGVPEALVSLHVLGSALVIISTAALWCGSRDRGSAPVSPVADRELATSN
ncbi:COX15/CtaA family protein [Amycolatopsis keratiniphila]|uniref:Cytochrome-c oxidase n=1 Tax=Amycolatopsis keratiniphila subsp. keratiniphila TaxID=227715 RepID=A0A1W2LM37_9PSEU|nr:COX15/CtaA family protein [Amycolatopsis keratiniphila]OLZ46313.1 cytochrome-c oxidase [Amycolatopsis keratiniphila subsp. nogabecina]ONF63999.1 cytochrome-c oxidase [Amycolatopsis keratiniphila subsp. keratiniphila]SDU31270.1 cytochrome c oxidase assembly protein subunit 15 [Amycolatopsis keratiniphila]